MTTDWIPYVDARAAFRRAATGVSTLCLRNPAFGPRSEALTVDTATIGDPTAANLLVVVSGTHGVEGLGGSLVQTRLLERWKERRANVPTGTCVLLVHALNPYGFAWSRRVTEGGVDLARNFLDFDRTLPENGAFEELREALVPSDFFGPGKAQADGALFAWIGRHGLAAFRAVACGQYTDPAAPFYGGTEPTWSNRTLRQLLAPFASTCRRVILLDIHTGIGRPGGGHMIGMHAEASVAARWGQALWPSSFAPMGNGDVGYAVTGSLANAVADELPRAAALVVTHELGVGSEREAVEALRADHWLHRYGDPKNEADPRTLAIRERMQRAFFDPRPSWIDAVHAQTERAVETALGGLAKLDRMEVGSLHSLPTPVHSR